MAVCARNILSGITHCQWKAVPIPSAPLWSQGSCEPWIQWGGTDQQWNTTCAWDSGTSKLPFALLSKNRSAACSSLSYSSSPQPGCFPLAYFGMEIRLSQSEVCQIPRKITPNCLGLLWLLLGNGSGKSWARERAEILWGELLALRCSAAFAPPLGPSSN